MATQVTLHGAAARQIIRSMAQSYAMLAVKSTLPSDCVNAPWSTQWQRDGGTWQAAYRKWMRGIDRERADYRKSLLSILPDLPEFPAVEWSPYKSPNGKTYSAIYSGPRAVGVAKAFAEQCAAALNL
jgi:hypothetical protein